MQLMATMRNAWRIKDIRHKLLFTLAMLLVYRLGSVVPVPGIDSEVVRDILGGGEGQGGAGLLGLFDLFAGGALSQFSIFAMGIFPYINASIIMQLLQAVIPKFEEWAKEGPEGRKKLMQFTRYGTVVLALIQSIGMSLAFRTAIDVPRAESAAYFMTLGVIILSLTAGTAFLMWLGEQITDKGIGNGISLIIFAGIVSRLPAMAIQAVNLVRVGEMNIFSLLLIVVLAVMVIAAMVYVTQGERRVPVQYAKRVVGRKMYGGASSHIPLKVNQSGVIPVIFATSLLMLPETIGQFWDSSIIKSIASFFTMGTWSGTILVSVLIVGFAYFYTAITVNPNDLADNMRKNGGFIPGIRPGRPTAGYIQRIMNRITLAGALFLAAIVALPYMLQGVVGIEIGIGGTSLLIVVGVALETMKQIESQMLMRHYKGFM